MILVVKLSTLTAKHSSTGRLLSRFCRRHSGRRLVSIDLPQPADYISTMSDRLNLARHYRPQSLDQVIGQKAAVDVLTKAIDADRIAPAYLFSGPRGTGKTTCARIFARAASCLSEDPQQRPCGKCDYCQAAQAGKAMDLMEIDGASHTGVDDVRSIIESIAYRPTLGRRNVYIIDEVHMLSNAAFNALLKTLEEPPAHALFLFATTEPEKIPETILSRVQQIQLRRIKEKEVIDNLQGIAKKESIQIANEVLQQIAAASDGCLRDAQTLLEQVILLSGSKKVAEDVVDSFLGTIGVQKEVHLLETIAKQEIEPLLEQVAHFYEQGKDLTRLLSRLTNWLRGLLVAKATGNTKLIQEDFDDALMKKLLHAFGDWSVDDLDRVFEHLWQGMERMKKSEMPKVTLETTLIRTTQILKSDDLGRIVDYLESTDFQAPLSPAQQAPTSSAAPSAPSPATRATTAKESKPTATKSPAEDVPQSLETADHFKQIIRAKKASLHGLIVCATKIEIKAQTVNLEFPKGHFAFKQISQKVLLEDIESLLKQATGQTYKLAVKEAATKIEAPSTANPGSPDMMKTVKKAVVDDPDIKKAQEILGGKIESVTIEGVRN